MRANSLKNRVSYYFRYTVLFLVTALIIYAPFLYFRKSFCHRAFQHVRRQTGGTLNDEDNLVFNLLLHGSSPPRNPVPAYCV